MADMIRKTLEDERIEAVTSRIPSGHITEASEIDSAHDYQYGEEAGFVAGQVVDISCEMMMR